jgi:hypothetical protein
MSSNDAHRPHRGPRAKGQPSAGPTTIFAAPSSGRRRRFSVIEYPKNACSPGFHRTVGMEALATRILTKSCAGSCARSTTLLENYTLARVLASKEHSSRSRNLKGEAKRRTLRGKQRVTLTSQYFIRFRFEIVANTNDSK